MAPLEAVRKSASESTQQAHTIRELLFGRGHPPPITLSAVETTEPVKWPPGSRGAARQGKDDDPTTRAVNLFAVLMDSYGKKENATPQAR
jgi:hypothetical protein